MKKILTPILILVVNTAFCQTSTKGDTLIIPYKKEIKFIKFGDKLYEVVQPSLKEVEQNSFQFRGVGEGLRFFDNNMIPSQKLLLKTN